MDRPCPECGKRQGTNAECMSCRDAAAQELRDLAKDVTEASIPSRAEAGRAFEENPPWWARWAPKKLLTKVRLLWMLLQDYGAGRYRRIPWAAIVTVAAALGYVLMPFDLIPDFLVPIGWTDDMVVLALAWRMIQRELKTYCEWKGLSPAHFNL
jgi:uncharacterized membrane protein YkvA (DUF1232 family)